MKKNIFFIFVIAILVLSLIGCQTEESTSQLSAALSELSSYVELKQAEQESSSPADIGITLDTNGQLQTADDGRVRLDLSSSVFNTNPNCRCRDCCQCH